VTPISPRPRTDRGTRSLGCQPNLTVNPPESQRHPNASRLRNAVTDIRQTTGSIWPLLGSATPRASSQPKKRFRGAQYRARPPLAEIDALIARRRTFASVLTRSGRAITIWRRRQCRMGCPPAATSIRPGRCGPKVMRTLSSDRSVKSDCSAAMPAGCLSSRTW
jgi:hypothetical protein